MKTKQKKDFNITGLEETQDIGGAQVQRMETSIEDSISLMAEESFGQTLGEMSSRLIDSRHQNTRLSEQLQETRATVEAKEEEVVKLSAQLADSHLEVKRLKTWGDLRQQTELENAELRQQVDSLCRELEEERQQVQRGEQEKSLLHAQLQRIQTQVGQLNSELTDTAREREDLKSLLRGGKDKVLEFTDLCASLEARLAEKDERHQELISCLQEFSSKNEELKQQSLNLQEQLMEAQQELFSVRSASDSSDGIRLPSPQELANEIEEDSETDEATSTCQWPPSIRNELQELFEDSPNLPWPLSGKELKESVGTPPDIVSHIEQGTDSKRQAVDNEQSVAQDKMSSPNPGISPEKSKSKCRCDFHYDISNEKLRMLVTVLRNFKGENERLRCMIKQTLADSGSPKKIDPVDEKICAASLYDVTLPEREREVSRLRKVLSEAQERVTSLQQKNDELTQVVTSLNRSNAELAEQLHISELRVSEISEEADAKSQELAREKQRSGQLEENLCSSALARQLDLKDIWRLVQKEVESECQDGQDDVLGTASPEQLKAKIKQDIDAIRQKLERRETALGLLRKSKLNLPTAWSSDVSHTSHCTSWLRNRRLSPSSPLLEALSIDMFNGNLPGYQGQYAVSPTAVSCEDVDCYECRAARLILQHRFTASCPSISVQQKKGVSIADGENNNSLPPGTAQDNLVSTLDNADPHSLNSWPDSETLPLPAKKRRSLYGSNRRSDFIRNSGRYPGLSKASAKKALGNSRDLYSYSNGIPFTSPVYVSGVSTNGRSSRDDTWAERPGQYSNMANQSYTSLSLDDCNNSFSATRRSSFKTAVENSQQSSQLSSMDSSFGEKSGCNVSADVCGTGETSPEELRRPSFCAAIEKGQQRESPLPPGQRESPLPPSNLKPIRVTNSGSNSPVGQGTGALKPAGEVVTKTVKFQLDEEREGDESSRQTAEYPGAVAWSSASRIPNLSSFGSDSFLSSSSSSSLAYDSTCSSVTSVSWDGSGDNRRFVLPGRAPPVYVKALRVDTGHLGNPSLEDWDLSPQSNVELFNGSGDRFTPIQPSESSTGAEPQGECGPVTSSADDASDMPTSMNLKTTPATEVTRGHDQADEPRNPPSASRINGSRKQDGVAAVPSAHQGISLSHPPTSPSYSSPTTTTNNNNNNNNNNSNNNNNAVISTAAAAAAAPSVSTPHPLSPSSGGPSFRSASSASSSSSSSSPSSVVAHPAQIMASSSPSLTNRRLPAVPPPHPPTSSSSSDPALISTTASSNRHALIHAATSSSKTSSSSLWSSTSSLSSSREAEPPGRQGGGAGSTVVTSSCGTDSNNRLKADQTLVPSSPPTPRINLAASPPAPPLEPSRLARIRQSHLASKKREQMKSRAMKLPELSEHSELDTTSSNGQYREEEEEEADKSSSPLSSNAGTTNSSGSAPPRITPQISVTDEHGATPPAPSDEPVTPSLPESFLKKLGLIARKGKEEEESVDQLPEKEIESKFVSLSLAFKTDKLTVDQRVSVQERARDLAEQNVDRELQGLREAVEVMSDLVPDSQVRDVLQRIRQHIDVLEQSAARVSSRAEVFGAVQQERRMCKAMEVMVLYTENLRRIREREESELQEARKVLSERSGPGLSPDFDSGINRRSMSVCGFNAGGRPPGLTPPPRSRSVNDAGDNPYPVHMRRRSEIALPRVLGGSGSPSLTQTSSMECLSPLFERSSQLQHLQSLAAHDSEDREDPRSRFQSAVASTSMQHAVTNTMRRVSMERRRSVTGAAPLTLVSSPPTLTVTPEVTGTEKEPESGDTKESERKVSVDEDAYRKGFEEGLKAQLSNELNDLREQQNSISHSLEQVMDRVDQAGEEDDDLLASRPSRVETVLTLLSKVREFVSQFDWRSNKKAIRNLAGIFFVFLAILIVFLSPPISTVDVRHFPKPPQ
ncbi:serine-rich adhesin for platelets [Aplysia californica]|uniref:Serine-rich adhesin for platelets n=1 Tax=Aplysia californica TaxID=6500 RepID=A0ABM1AA54_APLCA|nr:serine-rich adhesin for platelets [Aplysia californica]